MDSEMEKYRRKQLMVKGKIDLITLIAKVAIVEIRVLIYISVMIANRS